MEKQSAFYQISCGDLPLRRKLALAEYERGDITIGKLAKEMGMHVLDLQKWMKTHGIAQNSRHSDQDVSNA